MSALEGVAWTPQRSEDRADRGSRILALDGLRAVAVLGVMLFHTSSQPFQGGFLGVDVFFVLSGFLIAGILLDELKRRQRVALADFWLRRARRLAPALLLLLFAVGMARLATIHPDSQVWRADMLAALTYTTNWFQIVTGADYFAQFSQPSPLLHTWSLAIEEQFYLLFAVLMAFGLRTAGRRRMLVVFVTLALLSAVWMAVLASNEPVWAYYATMTRIQALLVGAILAVLVRHSSASRGRASRVQRVQVPAGWIAAAILCAAFVVPLSNDVMFAGGFLLVAVASAALIWSLLANGHLASALSWRPLVALGTISYGVYLWHWPIFLALGSHDDGASVATQVWAMLLTVGVAAVSFVLVERPIRTGRFVRLPAVRQWSAYGVAAALIVGLAVMPARTLPPDPQMPWPDAQAVPGRVLVAGDSTMFHLLKYFPRSVYPDLTVAGPVRMGCGFMDLPYARNGVIEDTDHCAGWQDEWRAKVEEVAPDVAVIGSTVWDGFDRVLPTGTYAPGSAEFDDAFLRAFRQAVALAGRDGEIPVYVVGQPCLASRMDTVLNDGQRSAHLDSLIRTAVQSMPNAHYIDTRSLTCSSKGIASDTESRTSLREDGVHWSQRGADVFWSQVLTQMASDRGSAG
jgi:peptidoglycan/LPS O-acetylase OafA/YrhL